MFIKSLDIIKQNFFEYLKSLGVSAASHKNYRSDLNHFSDWLILKVRSMGSSVDTFSEAIPFLNSQVANEYKTYLSKENVSVKTINRRLSTLRHLSRFLVSSETVDFDFMKGETNVIQGQDYTFDIVNRFAKFLENEKVSENTSKNYLSDVRQLFQSIN
jgi:site-specific recombinase XerD